VLEKILVEEEILHIPPIRLRWSDRVPWVKLELNKRMGGVSPFDVLGVYEVKYEDRDES